MALALATGLAGAAVVALVGLGLLGGLPVALRTFAVILSLGNAGGFRLAAITLLVPARLILLVMLRVIVAPVRILVRRLRPLFALAGDGVAASRPVGLGDRLALLAAGGGIDFPGAGKVAAGEVGALVDILRGQRPAAAVIDDYQLTALIAVAIAVVADEVGIVRARLVIIVAVAIGGRFDHAHSVVVTAPHPGAHAVVVDGVVGRSVAEGAVHRIAFVSVGVAPTGLGETRDAGAGRRRQLVGGGGCGHRLGDVGQLDSRLGRRRLTGVGDGPNAVGGLVASRKAQGGNGDDEHHARRTVHQ